MTLITLDDFLARFEKKYNKSQSPVSFDRYIKIALLGTAFISVLVFSFSYIYLNMVIGTKLNTSLSKALAFSIFSLVGSLTIFALYPNYRENVEKSKIENGLLYTVSYMAILANCGFSVDRIFFNAAEIEQNKSIKRMITGFIADIKIKGFDIEQALHKMTNRSPSKLFSEILSGISNANWTTGDLKQILAYHFHVLDTIRKDETENMINSLTVLSEIYVAMMVIAPIMMIIMFTLLSMLNGIKQESIVSILNSITFIFLPFAGTGFLILLDTLRGTD